jgi:hypothetical protein
MAINKKSFLLYSNWEQTFENLTDDEAGKLIKHVFRYVNDKNPVAPDRITELIFEPLKAVLKCDLIKYETIKEEKSISGRIGNLKRWNNDLFLLVESNKITLEGAEIIAKNRKTSISDKNIANAIKTSQKVAVNDNVNDNDIKVNNIDSRKLKFANTLKPFIDNYSKELIREFYNYWTEPNKSNTKFKQELERTWSLERRLETWAKNDTNFNNNNNTKKQKQNELTRITNEIRKNNNS